MNLGDKVEEQLLNYLPGFITVHGDMYKIDKNDKVLFISENYVFLYNFYEDDFASLCRVLTQEAEPNKK